jgi:hypothetical protein
MPNIQSSITLIENNGLNRGTVASGLAVSEKGNSVFHQTTITLSGQSVTMTDHTTAGSQGSQDLYTFPVGLIRIHGARVNLTLARVGTAIATTAAVVGSIGTAAAGAGDAVLTGTEADIHGSTACTLTSGAGAFAGTNSDAQTALTDNSGGTVSTTLASITAAGSYAQADLTALKNATASFAAAINTLFSLVSGRVSLLDGTGGAKTAKLNFAIPDAGSSGNDALLVSGTVTLTWQHLGT